MVHTVGEVGRQRHQDSAMAGSELLETVRQRYGFDKVAVGELIHAFPERTLAENMYLQRELMRQLFEIICVVYFRQFDRV